VLGHVLLVCVLALIIASFARAENHIKETKHAATGIVLKVSPNHRTVDVSCDEIPGYMSAMAMSFQLRNQASATSLAVGTKIAFNISEHGKTLYAEDIHMAPSAVFEPEPMNASGLGALHKALNPSIAKAAVKVGQPVPDFTLTDQSGNEVSLSQFQGKVVALTFGYSRCPNPNYCFRLSNNLAHVQTSLRARAGRDLVLLTIAIDPDNDKGEALARYAESFHADPNVWHFLTGPLPRIKEVSAMFGMDFWSNEGLLTHSMHTVILNRKGEIAANLEGNQFTSRQLTDLVRSMMDKP
jgi:protein SCO1/2